MKEALKVKITKEVNGKVTEVRESFHCSECESGNVYRVKGKKAIYCRKCGKLSKIKEEKNE